MLGLSSSYYGFQGKGIYESVKAVFDLGFDTVELGAGHSFEPKLWETVKRIKQDFPNKNYTVHGLFPPLQERTWFNASNGLTKKNREIVGNFFRAAQAVEASVVSVHPGFTKQLKWLDGAGPMDNPLSGKQIPSEKAFSNFYAVVERCLQLAGETGCVFAIENVPSNAIPLVCSRQQFETVFRKFPKLKLLLDVGHALYDGVLPEFLDAFSSRVGQIHLHITRPEAKAPKSDEHKPITSLLQLRPLSRVRQFTKIPVIFEHAPNTSPEQILAEKKIVKEFEENF